MASSSHGHRKKVSYYYDANIGKFYYGKGHPMKPIRIMIAHNLVFKYGLFRKMEVFHPHQLKSADMEKFHSEEYIRFLETIRPETSASHRKQLSQFNLDQDCPVFPQLFDFCGLSAGGSIAGAIKLNKEATDIAINWSGGLHHAKKGKASGFCYVNDIVLAILELLKYHQRVLYIDIDVHHGDGVEEAFLTTDRVMTVSFHKYGDHFFPGTGDWKDIGAAEGKYYAVNIPLLDGIDDESYKSIFNPVVTKILEMFKPSVIVLQCGADSLSGDRLGTFNLSLKGHAHCLEFLKKRNLPLLLLGGGGYTVKNVSRCWAYETAVALGIEIPEVLPQNDFMGYFDPDYDLHIEIPQKENKNTRQYLDTIKVHVFENLRMLPCVPSVEMKEVSVEIITLDDSEDEDNGNPDERMSQQASDKRVAKDNEFYDSEDDGNNRRRWYINAEQKWTLKKEKETPCCSKSLIEGHKKKDKAKQSSSKTVTPPEIIALDDSEESSAD